MNLTINDIVFFLCLRKINKPKGGYDTLMPPVSTALLYIMCTVDYL